MNANSAHRLIMLQHELLMALGNASDPNEVLERFTMRSIKTLNLRCLYLLQKQNQDIGLEAKNYCIPLQAPNIDCYPHLDEYRDKVVPSNTQFIESIQRGSQYWYCFALKGLGYMILERAVKPFDTDLINALSIPIGRFAQSYLGRMQFLLNEQNREKIKIIYERLQVEKSKLQHILNAINDTVLVLDQNGMVFFINPAGCRLLSVDESYPNDTHFTHYFKILDSRSLQDITRDIATVCESEGEWFYEKPVVLKTHQDRQLVVRLNVQRMEEIGQTQDVHNYYFVCTLHDITEAHELEQELKWRATHDSLTLVYNRRGFEDKINNLVQSSRDNPAVLICMDLDRFKHVNDIGGHPAGDALLQQVTVLMQKEIRQSDILARVGGDEFCLVLQHCNMDSALKVAEKIRRDIDQLRFKWEDNIFTIGISLGVTEIKTGETDADAIFLRADEACLLSKENGRNQVTQSIDEVDKVSPQRSNINYLHCVNKALLSHDSEYQMVLYQQDILPVLNPMVKAHQEVLLRICHQGKLILPNAFLPAAERSGKICDIDLWVLAHTLKYLKKHKTCMLNVNISGVTLSSGHARSSIFKLISEYPAEARLLCLEITETSAITNLAKCIAFMNKLKYLGVHFALDDFGTGVSSFSYLKSLPVSYLKIDGSFIRDICYNEIDEIMVKSIISAAKAMKISTVAEYVNDADILAKVSALGIDYVQGYCVSEPQVLEIDKIGLVSGSGNLFN